MKNWETFSGGITGGGVGNSNLLKKRKKPNNSALKPTNPDVFISGEILRGKYYSNPGISKKMTAKCRKKGGNTCGCLLGKKYLI